MKTNYTFFAPAATTTTVPQISPEEIYLLDFATLGAAKILSCLHALGGNADPRFTSLTAPFMLSVGRALVETSLQAPDSILPLTNTCSFRPS